MVILDIVKFIKLIVKITWLVPNVIMINTPLQKIENTVIYWKILVLLIIVNFMKIWMGFRDVINVKMVIKEINFSNPIIIAENVLLSKKTFHSINYLEWMNEWMSENLYKYYQLFVILLIYLYILIY